MTLAARILYCRRTLLRIAARPDFFRGPRVASPSNPYTEWLCWLAEHDGLMVGAGVMSEIECREEYQSDARVRLWYQRGLEDGQVLKDLEDSQKILLDTLERPC